MQGAVLATIDSVCLSDRLSVTVRYHVEMVQATIMRSSLQDSPMTVVSSWLTSARNSKWNISGRSTEWKTGIGKIRNFSQYVAYFSNGRPWLQTWTNRKSHMGFRLVPKSSTLDDLETLNGRYALYCRKDASFGAHCKNVNEDIIYTHAISDKNVGNDSSLR